MIIEGEFFSGGHLRWNLGWPTPNYAGAFLVTLLALCWMFSGSRWRWAYFAAEAGGLFLLAKTYSRGAVVAWGLAWLFGFVASRKWRLQPERWVWAARVGVLAVMMLAVGFGWSRAGEKTTGPQDDRTTEKRATSVKVPSTEDGSVVNRLALWQGGLKMIAVAPLTGWGEGESGRGYMNWYQDVDRPEAEGYTTMVNSYLHVAVEHGLPVLAGVLWVAAWLLLVAWRGARDDANEGSGALGITRPTLMMATGASLVAWMVANVFTTLWIEPKLWIVPAMAGVVLGWSVWKNSSRRLVSLTIASLAIAVCGGSSLYAAGHWLLGKQPLAFQPGVNGSVSSVAAGSVESIWHAWPDPAVLGSTPGKELRRWLESSPTNTRLTVHRAAPLQPGEVPAEATGIMLFGRQAERIGSEFPPDCRELWLIHPTVPPPTAGKSPKLSAETITLILPQIDEIGNGPAWRDWAARNGAQVIESPSCGLDIRPAWPAVLNPRQAP